MPENPDLKQWLLDWNLTQPELAERLPVNLRTLQEWVAARGKGQPPPYLWRAVEHLESELRASKTRSEGKRTKKEKRK